MGTNVFEKSDFNGDNHLSIMSTYNGELIILGKGGIYLSKKEVKDLINKLKSELRYLK